MADGDRLAHRNGEIWRAYVAGKTQDAIAAEFGLSQRRVSDIIAEVRETIPPEDRAHLVQREADFLDEMRQVVLELVQGPPIPAYSNGRPILMPDGSIAEDHSGRLAAWDRAIKAHERLAKLLGLDAAAKVEATVTAPEELEVVQRIRAWKAAQGEAADGGAADG